MIVCYEDKTLANHIDHLSNHALNILYAVYYNINTEYLQKILC